MELLHSKHQLRLSITKDAGKILNSPYSAPESTWLFPLCFTITRFDQNLIKIAVLLLYLCWNFTILTFQLWQSKIICVAMWVMTYFPPYCPFPTDVANLLLLYHYLYGKCLNELHSLVLPIQTFTAKTLNLLKSATCSIHGLHLASTGTNVVIAS